MRDDSVDDPLELDLDFTDDDDNATSAPNPHISPLNPSSDRIKGVNFEEIDGRQVVETPQGRRVNGRWHSRFEFIHGACNQWTTLPLEGGNHDIHDLILWYWGDGIEDYD